MKNRTTKSAIRRTVTMIVAVIFLLTVTIIPVFAEGDGVTDSLAKFNDLLFAVIRLIGVAVCAVGAVEFGLALQSHDGSQKARGVTIFAAGLFIFFVKEILTSLGVSL